MRAVAIAALIALAALPAHAFDPASGGPFLSRALVFTGKVTAPETVIDLDGGRTSSLTSYRGKVAVVTLWATWCHVCAIEMPIISAFAAGREGDVAFLPVSIDEDIAVETVAAHLRREGLARFPVMVDRNQALAIAVGVRGTPTTLIVDKFGQVTAAFEGQAPWDGDMAAYLEALSAAEDAESSLSLLAGI